MKGLLIGCALACSTLLGATPAWASGHYNIQVWQLYTDNCDSVTSGQVCNSVLITVSTSTWCGSSCSSGEKAGTFNKAMTELYDTWAGGPNDGYDARGFRGLVTPICHDTYLNCQSPPYSGGYSSGKISVSNQGDYSSGSRNDYVNVQNPEVVIIKP